MCIFRCKNRLACISNPDVHIHRAIDKITVFHNKNNRNSAIPEIAFPDLPQIANNPAPKLKQLNLQHHNKRSPKNIFLKKHFKILTRIE